MLMRLIAIGVALGLSGCSVTQNNAQADTQAAANASQEAPTLTPYYQLPAVRSFVERMVNEHDYDRNVLVSVFSSTYKREQVITKSDNQPEVITPYYAYRERFLDQARVSQGARFAKRNQKWLAQAEQQFGVDRHVIVALLGVETAYGNITGNRDVFTSLTTLAFDYPRRGQYFQSELEAYLLLARKEGWEIGTTNGSYSGALGMVQFMPSNYLKLAIDFDKDGHIDLWGSEADAIGSIANYMKHHGWRYGERVAIPARVADRDKVDDLVNKGRSPLHSMQEWAQKGVWVTTDYSAQTAGLIGLREQEEQPTYWLAFENFFTIMDYNPSRRYAMSVWELANRIAQYEDS
ncbi:lytic murein transglycosylase B [Marinomonas ostreistagni]|uniref:lytic murein transglycosylase B n=1 Tax=Marinomonas ostreistagni TaxID=359209 RepID=UPI001951BDBD|nr:lytic murein transglycosylase B [Marinomonas ostreistagni]MBM6550467.1 lytic murein transglycosylase B [Marinomonas ostreistagni]